MKKVIVAFMVIGLIGLVAAPAWAGGPEETARERVEWAAEMEAQGPNRIGDMVPQVGLLYFIDLMSNDGDWQSFLVVGNWSLNIRIRLVASFIPTGGDPSDIVSTQHFINPNDVIYLTENDLGFNTFGDSNWFGNINNFTDSYFSCGVLLYHTEYGLAWLPGDGPYQI